jgi:hypothetical protein
MLSVRAFAISSGSSSSRICGRPEKVIAVSSVPQSRGEDVWNAQSSECSSALVSCSRSADATASTARSYRLSYMKHWIRGE